MCYIFLFLLFFLANLKFALYIFYLIDCETFKVSINIYINLYATNNNKYKNQLCSRFSNEKLEKQLRFHFPNANSSAKTVTASIKTATTNRATTTTAANVTTTTRTTTFSNNQRVAAVAHVNRGVVFRGSLIVVCAVVYYLFLYQIFYLINYFNCTLFIFYFII